MIDIEGLELIDADIKRIKHPLVGGIILFTRNFKNKVQLKKLIISIRKLKKNLLIAVDHEGGRVQRFKDEFTNIPKMNNIGLIYQEDKHQANIIAKLTGWVIANELAEIDIDFSFTPVLDVDYGNSSIIGDRAFHQNVQVISELASSLVEGLNFGGMQSVGKHFPGHGFIKADTHLETATDNRSLETIQNNDMLTFERLIKNGIRAIMPSHVVYSSCDQDSAGLSYFWLQDQLRKRLKFEGAILSDDMSMRAAQDSEGNISLRVKRAFIAGCDMVLFCNSPKEVDELLGDLEWKPIEESLRRLESLKLNKEIELGKKLKYCDYSFEEAQLVIANI
tara:strand:+ start:479 stop:1483 length:1005 start_codon:yes stop_codon:yes gene_type:complete